MSEGRVCDRCGCSPRGPEDGGSGGIELSPESQRRYGVSFVCGTCIYWLKSDAEVIEALKETA